MPDKTTPKFELTVDGSPVPKEAVEAVIAISCRQDLDMADTVEVRLKNADLRFTEGETFAEGKKLAVKLGYVETDMQLIASGEIVRRDCEFPERGPAIVTIVALDKEFRLKHGKKTKVFKDVKDSDVVSQLCGDAGLSADVDSTDIQHKYLFQVNQSNLEFIRERARRLNYIVQIDRENSKLSFKKPKTGDSKITTLKWGKDLMSFRPRFSTDEQFQKVLVRGWDMTQKKAIMSEADPKGAILSSMGVARLGAELAKHSGGPIKILYPETPMFTTDEAEQMAKAYANAILQRYVDGEGSAQGSNKICPGIVVEIDGCGKRANGNFYVHSTLHHYEPKGYTTYFSFLRPSDTAQTVPIPPPPPLPPRKDGPEPPSKNSIEFQVMVGDGVEYSKLSYTATAPDGTSKQGNIEPGGTIKMDDLKKPGDATFVINAPPDVIAFRPGQEPDAGGGAGGGGGGS